MRKNNVILKLLDNPSKQPENYTKIVEEHGLSVFADGELPAIQAPICCEQISLCPP